MILLPGCRCCGSDCDPVWSGDWACGVGAVDLLEKVTVDWSAAEFDVTPSAEPWPGDGRRPNLEMWEIYFPKQYDLLETAQADRAYWKHVTIAEGQNPDLPVEGWGPTEVLNWKNSSSSVSIRCRSDGALTFSCRNVWEVMPLPEYLLLQKYFFFSSSCFPPTTDLYEFDLTRIYNEYNLYLTDEQTKDFLNGQEVLPRVEGYIMLDFNGFSCDVDFANYQMQTYETPNTLDGQTQRPKIKMDC